MNVLIVEDETTATDNLRYLLRKVDPTIKIVGFAESIEQTVKIINDRQKIDMIFMDIHLSDGSAFNIFDRINVDIPIVFTTAYDQYALKAFKVNSIDYLLKPIKLEALKNAVEKFHKRTHNDILSYIASMSALVERNKYPVRLLLPYLDKLIPVPVSEICYIYSTNRQTKIVLSDSCKIKVSKTLEQLEATLDPNKFIRANKQFIICKESIKELVTWFDSRLLIKMIIDTPEEIYISKNRVAEFKSWLVKE